MRSVSIEDSPGACSPLNCHIAAVCSQVQVLTRKLAESSVVSKQMRIDIHTSEALIHTANAHIHWLPLQPSVLQSSFRPSTAWVLGTRKVAGAECECFHDENDLVEHGIASLRGKVDVFSASLLVTKP